MGRERQGPGEFDSPSSVVVLDDGRVLVRDDSNSRFNVFDGTTLVVERRIARAPASDAQRAWSTLVATATRRRNDPEGTWNGPPVPVLPGEQ